MPETRLSGTGFLGSISGVKSPAREAAFLTALLDGHVPDSMRTFVAIEHTFKDAKGVDHVLQFQVTQDYLTIGTDDDRFRVPLWPITHQKICDAWNCVMPTYKLVDLIWKASNKLPPQPWGPPYDATMHSTERMSAQSGKIDAKMRDLKIDPATLVGGHKKDVILTNKLVTHPKQVSIYGWHQANGAPIQGLPLYMGHENTYSDYSHGNRLVSRDCMLDGQADDMCRIMCDLILAVGVSGEGPLKLTRQP